MWLTQTTCGYGGAHSPLECNIGRRGEGVVVAGWCRDDILGKERTEAGVSSWLGSNLNLSREWSRRHARQTGQGANPPSFASLSPSTSTPPPLTPEVFLLAVAYLP